MTVVVVDHVAQRRKSSIVIEAAKLHSLIDGGIILSKTIKDKHVLARQILLYRDFIKAVFLGL